MSNYATLDIKLHRGDKEVPSRKVGNNTYAQRRPEGAIAIRLHHTDVVTHYSDGTIVLNTGGWYSMTTKARMNEFTPQHVQVFSDKGRWMVTWGRSLKTYADGQQFAGPNYDQAVAYKDHLSLIPAGQDTYTVVGALDPAERVKQDAHNKQINKWIDRYLRHVSQARFDHLRTWPHDIACSMCLVFHGEADKIGNTGRKLVLVGEQMGDTQHLIDHLLDKEIPYSLWLFASRKVNPSGGRVNILDLAKADLRKYLRASLLVGQTSTRGGVRRVA